jgi:hypothetical protein
MRSFSRFLSFSIKEAHFLSLFRFEEVDVNGLPRKEFVADAPERTDLFAFKTPDAVRAVGGLVDPEVHGALVLALTAESARFLVHRHPE